MLNVINKVSQGHKHLWSISPNTASLIRRSQIFKATKKKKKRASLKFRLAPSKKIRFKIKS